MEKTNRKAKKKPLKRQIWLEKNLARKPRERQIRQERALAG
jgi:hypothetical protein